MKATCSFLILLLAVLANCSDDPYPVYEEGELQWIVTDTPVIYEGSDMEPLVTPDGKQVVFRASFDRSTPSPRLLKRDLVTGVESFIHTFGYAMDISPDGQWLVFNSSYGVISKIKLDGENLSVLPLVSTGSGNFSPAWSPSGNEIVYVHHSDDINFSGVYIFTSANLNVFMASSGGHPDFFPDGRRVISTKGFDESIWKKFPIHDIETKQELARLDASPHEDNDDPQVSPEGDRILYRNVNGIHLMNSDGSNVNNILPSEHFYEHPQGDYLGFLTSSASWHPDGKHIVYQHFAITKYEKCPDFCTYDEIFTGIVSIRKLRVVD